MTNEAAARKLFEVYCSEGVRPMMYNLTQTASGEYVSQFTEWAWKLYWKGIDVYKRQSERFGSRF